MNKYLVKNTRGQFARLVNGRLYNINGDVARFMGRDSNGEFKFLRHKTFEATIPIDASTKIRFATKDEVNKYLAKAS